MYVIEKKMISFFFLNDLLFKISGDNFDGILKELGVNKVIRTIAKTVKPRLTINEKNGKWLFKSESTFKTTSFEFTPGVEFDDLSPTGDQLKVRTNRFLLID